MDVLLDDIEVRVLGCLMEKEAATPEYYPLSLNALVNACNQKSNRDPVVAYDDQTVEEALARLRSKGLAVRITGGDSRVPKHAHRLGEVFNFSRPESAVLCVLMLRGPQTSGELRGRAERLYTFDDIAGVESCLARLGEWQPAPLVRRLPRQPGSREARWAQLFAGDVEATAAPAPEPVREAPPPERDRLARLEAEVQDLRREIAELREQFGMFRKQFE